jgi:hypothetical protein
LKIIIHYFPLLTYTIVILGATYFIYRRIWITDRSGLLKRSLSILVLVILFAALDVIVLTTPVISGIAGVDSLPQLLMWIWPDIIVLVALVADLSRSWHRGPYQANPEGRRQGLVERLS